jgi:hypothetical protein
MPEQNLEIMNDGTPILPVLVWGTAANGKMFREHVTAKELTHDGALLIGMPYPISVGDLIGLQYRECKAHVRVARIPQLSGSNSWSLWVELLEKSRCPWAGMESVAPPVMLPQVTSGLSRERRQCPRYPLSLPVHIQVKDAGGPIFFHTKDISASGCYIETIFPLLKGLEVNVILRLDSTPFVCNGMVRTSDVNVGMGIEFVGLSETARAALAAYIKEHVEDESPDLMRLAAQPSPWSTTELGSLTT